MGRVLAYTNRWTRRSQSVGDTYDNDAVARGFEKVYENTTEESLQNYSADAEAAARVAVSRRRDRTELNQVNQSPPEAFHNLAHRSRRRRLNYTFPAAANNTTTVTPPPAPSAPPSPPTDPRGAALRTLAGAAQGVQRSPDSIDLTDADVEALPVASVDSDGLVRSVSADTAYDRFLAIDANTAPAGGLTIAHAPTALLAPNLSSSSSDLDC